MRYWIDSEFEVKRDGTVVLPISIALVGGDGREFYAEVVGAHHWVESEWLIEHVLPHLSGGNAMMSPFEIGVAINHFVGADPAPEFWGWCSGFDYVVLSGLMGGMDAWPRNWPHYLRDLQQSADYTGDDLETMMDNVSLRHHALDDARETRRLWEGIYGDAQASSLS